MKRRKPTIRIPKTLKASKNFPSSMELEGVVTFQAAEAKEGEKGKPPSFTLVANTGRPMRLRGFFDPVIVSMAGAKFDKKTTPVIMDHDTSKRVGHTTSQQIDVKGSRIVAEGVVSSTSAYAKEYVEDSKGGFPFQVSLGADILEGEYVPEGQKVTVNGKSWKGPLIVANKSVIRELTVTVLGADNGTSSKVAAQAKTILKGNAMETFEAFVAGLGLDLAAMDDDQTAKVKAQYDRYAAAIRAGGNADPTPKTKPGAKGKRRNIPAPIHAASDPEEDEEDGEGTSPLQASRQQAAEETERVTAIGEISATYDDSFKGKKLKLNGKEVSFGQLKAHAIREGWDANQFELFCMRAERPLIGSGAAPAGHSIDRNIQQQALEAAVLRWSGMTNRTKNPVTGREYGLECCYKPEVLEASHGRQYQFGGSIQALLDLQIRAAGKHFGGITRHGSDFVATAVEAYESIKASGFSTLNVVNVLENVLNKSAYAAFEAVEAVWRYIAGRKPLNDFKPHALYRLDYTGHFRKVAADGELKHISMTDTKKTIQADTFGAILTIDRKTIRNDDLGLILDQARGMGSLGAQRIEESVMVLILANAGSFFGAGNGNLITGAGSALSVTSLNDARQKFRDQVVNGKPIGISPRVLLVGTTNETVANQLHTDDHVQAVGNTDALKFVSNPHKGLYRPYVSGYLNNTGITDQDGNALSGQSATQWFLFGDPDAPQGSAVVIGFVDGKEVPYFDEAETQFNVPGGLQFRSYGDWGVALHIHQLGVKSAGA